MDDLSEHTPLSGLDEYLIHNHPNPVRVMWTTDPRAYERVWMAFHDRDGHLAVALGLGFYPNLDTAEAFAIVTIDGVARSVHAHRPLGLDRTDMTVGPFRFEIVRPFREWRVTIAANELGIEADVRWFDESRAVYASSGPYQKPTGQTGGMTNGYESFGSVGGWIRVDGEHHAVERATHPGTRDHHWGVRDGVGGRGLYQGGKWPLSGFWVRFDGWGLWGDRLLLDLGDQRPGAIPVVGRECRLRFEPDEAGGMLTGGEADLLLGDGSVRHLRFERTGNQVLPMRLGMYPSPQGGTPASDLWPGMAVGDVVLGERHDLNDAATRLAVRGLDDVVCRFELDGEVAVGLAEPFHPVCQQACEAMAPGYRLLADLPPRGYGP